MGKRGPQKTPTAILDGRGSWRGKVRKGDPRPEPYYPKCPEWMGLREQAVWDRLIPELFNLGIMTRLDAFAFSRYCAYSVLWLSEFENEDRKEGTLEKYSNQLSRLESSFGLTPSSRASLDVKSPDKKDDGYLKIV